MATARSRRRNRHCRRPSRRGGRRVRDKDTRRSRWCSIWPASAYSLSSNQFAFPDGPARALEASGDLDGAIAAYRGLLTPDVANMWTLLLEPRYVLAIARLHAKKGDRAAARQEYQRFLDLWKNADAGQPEIAEAKRGLAVGS